MDYVLHPCEMSFLSSYKFSSNAVNRVMFISLKALDFDHLFKAWEDMASKHEAFRFRYTKNEHGIWYRKVVDLTEKEKQDAIVFVDLSSLKVRKLREQVFYSLTENWMRKILEAVQKGAPLWKIGYVHFGERADNSEFEGEGMFVGIFHHLIADGWTFSRILFPHFISFYLRLPIELPQPITSYIEWCHILQEYRNSNLRKRDAKYWRDQLQLEKILKFKPQPAHGDGFWKRQFSEISQDDAHTLEEKINQNAGTTHIGVLAAAMLHLTGMTQGLWEGFIRFLYHGRRPQHINKDVNINHTAGLFFSTSFEYCSIIPHKPVWDQVRLVSEQLNNVPNGGIDWLLYATSQEGREHAKKANHACIHFNYVHYGQESSKNREQIFGSTFKMLEGKTLEATRFHGMPEPNAENVVRVFVFGRAMQSWDICFEYNDAVYPKQQINRLCEEYANLLSAIARSDNTCLASKI